MVMANVTIWDSTDPTEIMLMLPATNALATLITVVVSASCRTPVVIVTSMFRGIALEDAAEVTADSMLTMTSDNAVTTREIVPAVMVVEITNGADINMTPNSVVVRTNATDNDTVLKIILEVVTVKIDEVGKDTVASTV